MTPIVVARLVRLGRWPRRVAALLCLLLAAASALSAQHPRTAAAPADGHRPAGLSARLRQGQLAVPVTLSDSAASDYVHVGARIDLFAARDTGDPAAPQEAALVGSGLQVIDVSAPTRGAQETGGTRVIVAADRATAARLAALAQNGVLAVLTKYP